MANITETLTPDDTTPIPFVLATYYVYGRVTVENVGAEDVYLCCPGYAVTPSISDVTTGPLGVLVKASKTHIFEDTLSGTDLGECWLGCLPGKSTTVTITA